MAVAPEVSDMNGTVATGFEPVREAFARNFEALGERGAGVVVHRGGHKVVDLWAGTRDVSGGAPWERGTAQIMRSATKGVAAAALLLLHQRGELDLDAPVSAYWPEFKEHGKEHVSVRDVLAHRAGCPRARPPADRGRGRRPRHRRRGRRRPGPRLGARHRPRLPRTDLQLAHRRARAPRHRPHRRRLDRRAHSRPRRRRPLGRAARRRGAPGRNRRPRRTMRPRPAACAPAPRGTSPTRTPTPTP